MIVSTYCAFPFRFELKECHKGEKSVFSVMFLHFKGLSKGDDNRGSVISEVQNRAFEEDTIHSEKTSMEKAEQLEESIYRINNEKLRNLEERESIKLSKAKAMTLLALSKEHQATEPGIKIDKIDFSFLDDQVTDLDELSNPRSPGLMLNCGSPRQNCGSPRQNCDSPRHDFANSETELDFQSAGDQMLRSDSHPNLNTNTKQTCKSRSTQSLTELTSTSAGNRHDYINMSYSNSDETGNRSSALKEVKDDLKKAFISRYTLEFQKKEEKGLLKTQNSPSSTTSNISEIGPYGGAPRRQSYTLAISSDEEGNTMVRDVLSASTNTSSPIYDVPRNSGGFEMDVDSVTANLEDCKSLNSYSNPDKDIIKILSPEDTSSEKRNHNLEFKDSSLLNSEGGQVTANMRTVDGDENLEETSENFAMKSSSETNLKDAKSFGAYF